MMKRNWLHSNALNSQFDSTIELLFNDGNITYQSAIPLLLDREQKLSQTESTDSVYFGKGDKGKKVWVNPKTHCIKCKRAHSECRCLKCKTCTSNKHKTGACNLCVTCKRKKCTCASPSSSKEGECGYMFNLVALSNGGKSNEVILDCGCTDIILCDIKYFEIDTLIMFQTNL
eukprot:Pgem_evm2s8972